jgi:hypothetical protein
VNFLAVFGISFFILSLLLKLNHLWRGTYLEPVEVALLGVLESQNVDTVLRLLNLGKRAVTFENHHLFNSLLGGSILPFKLTVTLLLLDDNDTLPSIGSAHFTIVLHNSSLDLDSSFRSSTSGATYLLQELLKHSGVHVIHICFSLELTN